MDIKKRLLLLLLCFISIVPSIAQRDHIDISNYILCINSYAESSPWSNRMISTVTEYVQKDPQLALYAEHMNMLMIENDSTLAEFKLSISQKYKRHRPRLLILLGTPPNACLTNIFLPGYAPCLPYAWYWLPASEPHSIRMYRSICPKIQ